MPDWSSEIRERLARLGLAPAREAAIVEELALHLADLYAELRDRGIPAEAAEAQVRTEHLNDAALSAALEAVEPRAAEPSPPLGAGQPAGWLSGFWSDLRFAARSLRKSPGLVTVVLLTLAVSIGANTAIFSTVHAVLLRRPPFQDPDRLVSFWGTAPEKRLAVVNYPDALYTWYRTRIRSMDPMAMYSGAGFTLTGAGEPERLNGATVTVDFFRLLGVAPQQGRVFLPEEGTRGRNLVTVLSYGFWQRRFGGDPSVVGQSLMLDDIPTTVVGIMPPGFSFPDRTALWIPLAIDPTSIDCWCYDAIGRMAPGRTRRDVAREIDLLNADFWAEREGRPRLPPSTSGRSRTIVKPLAVQLVGEVRTPLLVLLGAVGMVLLIACANMANLMLARATARSRDVAIRSALGASPGRIARQLLAESLLLSLSGAALGLLVAQAGLAVLGRAAVERVTYLERIGLHPVVLGFAVLLGVATGVLFGLVPALRAMRIDLVATLKEGARSSAAAATRRLNDAFVVAQLALSLILLVGAGLLLRSVTNLLAVDPGFQARNVVVGRIAVPWTTYREMPQVRELADRLADRVRVLPGVVAAGLSSTAPFSSNDNQQELIVQGQEPGPDGPVPVASVRRVSSGYFEAVGTPLIEGRAFTTADRDGTEPVAIVDASVAEQYWPGGSALGKRISTTRRDPVWRTVVGVAASIRHQHLDRSPDHYVYFPLAQDYAWALDLVVRSTVPTTALVRSLRTEIAAVDPKLPL
ncbi:MAG TPA: ABC transporter permease, partial [Gemmatimonadales bacterium]